MDPKLTPFLPITIQRAVFKPRQDSSPDPTVKITSSLYQSGQVNQQMIYRPISQIIQK
ncbi:MAG: hypothetical protein AAFU67_16590 [Bacteroidota bacterium]